MSRNSAEDTATNPKMSAEIPGTGDSNDKENAREMQETQGRCMPVYLFLIPFSTIFIAQLAPPSLLSPCQGHSTPSVPSAKVMII